MDTAIFKKPSSQYYNINLWMLNDRLEVKELERQLEEIAGSGCTAVIARTFFGLMTRYLSKEFIDGIRAIVEKAGRLGMEVYLQAGYMPSGIQCIPEKHMLRVLTEKSPLEAAGRQVLAQYGDKVFCVDTGKNCINFFSDDAVNEYIKLAYEEPWQDLKEYFGGIITSIWVDEPYFEPGTLPWNEDITELFGRMWGYPVTDAIPSLFCDEEEFDKVKHHYYRTIVQLFQNVYFKYVSDWCGANGLQFSGHLMGEDSFGTQIAHMGNVMPYYRYMDIPGIDHLTGSLYWMHGIADGRKSNIFLLTPKQCASAANQAGRGQILAEMYAASTEGITLEERKYIGDFLAVTGINMRCLHASFYSMRGRRKRIYVPHLSYQQPWWLYSRVEADYFARLCYALRQGCYHADVLVIHSIETAYGYFTPLKYKNMYKPRTPGIVEHFEDEYVKLLENLMSAHISFELGDEEIIAASGRITDEGKFAVGCREYKSVILPSMTTIRETTLKLIEAFAAKGGKIVSAGNIPSLVDGFENNAAAPVLNAAIQSENDSEALHNVMKDFSGSDMLVKYTDDAGNIWLHTRRTEKGSIVFIYNRDKDHPHKIEISFKNPTEVTDWNLKDGNTVLLECCFNGKWPELKLSLPPGTSRLLFAKSGMENGMGGMASANTDIYVKQNESKMIFETAKIHNDGWDAAPLQPNVLTLDYCRFAREDEKYSEELPVTAVQEILTEENYSGNLSLCYRFMADAVCKKMYLGMEDDGSFEIYVNGKKVLKGSKEFFMDRFVAAFDITDLAVRGENLVEMVCVFAPLNDKREDTLELLYRNVHGTELEAVYIIGSFGVECRASEKEAANQCFRCAPDFKISRKPCCVEIGNIVESGYPFYVGTFALKKLIKVHKLQKGERAVLKINGFHCCLAEVFVNFRKVGFIAWKPYEADITDCLEGEEAHIEIQITNTLRNLFGPHHRPLGETDYNWGEGGFYSGRVCPESGEKYVKWYMHASRETKAWTDDYSFVRFGIKDVEILYIKG